MTQSIPPMQSVPPVQTNLDYRGTTPEGNVWQAGFVLYVGNGATLPHRCVKCNSEDGVKMRTKTFTWYPPWVNLLVLAGVLVAVIVMLILQKKCKMTFGLCAKHRQQRLIATLITVGGCLLLPALLVATAIVLQNGWPVLLAALALLGTAIYGVIALPILKPTLITDTVGRFKGASPMFLGSLPVGPKL